MDDNAIWQNLREVFEETFDREDLAVGAETTATDIEEWDSVTHIELVVAVEEKFGIRLNTGEMASMENVGRLVDFIKRRVAERA